MRRAVWIALLLGLTALAGCSSKDPADPEPEKGLKDIPVDSQTGGIRGVVVDQAIRPVKGASVAVLQTGANVTTGADGLFTFARLKPGTYIVRATNPVYDEVQTSVEVVAGVADPKPVRIMLTRQIAQDPYMVTTAFNGYIACSAGVPGVGYSEECGEGVGVPCEVPPPAGCERAGGQGNNIVQNDFRVDSAGIRTIIVEQTWEPTTGTTGSGQLYTTVNTNWVCDPTCHGEAELGEAEGGSPLLIRIDEKRMTAIYTDPAVRISAFTWAGAGEQPNTIVDQPYQQFVSFFYWAPAPEGWSFIEGDPDPFEG